MKVAIQILPATPSDIDILTQVEIASKAQSMLPYLESFEMDYEKRFARWQTYFAGQSPTSAKPERVVFKALIENELIGYIAGHLTTRYHKDAEIQSFYVLKEYQRKGVGLQLLQCFVKWLIELEAGSLCVGIAEANPYQAFYLKFNGKYLNPHWIYWDDLNKLLQDLS